METILTPTSPIHVAKNTVRALLWPWATRTKQPTVTQKSHKVGVRLTSAREESTGINGGAKGVVSFSLFSFAANCFARNRLETKKLPHLLIPSPLSPRGAPRMYFARFRNINCALPVKRCQLARFARSRPRIIARERHFTLFKTM